MSSDSSSNSEVAIIPEHRREKTSTDISSSGSTEHSSNASLVRKNSRVVEVGSGSRVPIRAPERMNRDLREPEGQVPTDLVQGREPNVKTDEDAPLHEVGEGGAQDPDDDDMMLIVDRPCVCAPVKSTLSSPETVRAAMLIGGAPPGIIIQVPEPEERPWDAPEGFICVYEAYFREAGLTFSLPRLLFAYCNRRGCAISQLQLASIVNFVGILQLGRDVRAHINMAQFEELFIMKVSSAKSWFLSVNCNPKFDLVTGNKASKFPNWDQSYFFVRVDSSSAENPESTFRTGWSVDFDRHVPGFIQRSLPSDLAKQLSLAGQRRWPLAYREKIDRRIKRAQDRAKTKAEPSSSRPVPKKKKTRKISQSSRRRMAFDRSDIPMMDFGADEEEDNALIDIVGLDENEASDGVEAAIEDKVDNVPVGPVDPLIPVAEPEGDVVGTSVPEAAPQPQMEEGEIGEQDEDELTIADRARRKKGKSSKKSSRKRGGDPEMAASEGTLVLRESPNASQIPPADPAAETGNPRSSKRRRPLTRPLFSFRLQYNKDRSFFDDSTACAELFRKIVPASSPMPETKDLFRPKSYARVAKSASALVCDTNELVREYDSEVERLRKINAEVAAERASLEASYWDEKKRYEAAVLAFTEKEKENGALKKQVGALEKRTAELEGDMDALSKSFKTSELERRRYRDAESKGRKMLAVLRGKCEGKLAKMKDFMDKSELRKAPFLKLNQATALVGFCDFLRREHNMIVPSHIVETYARRVKNCTKEVDDIPLPRFENEDFLLPSDDDLIPRIVLPPGTQVPEGLDQFGSNSRSISADRAASLKSPASVARQ
ncbi:meiosis-specific protein ASY2-like [Eutrema salsugineum]|uniref:meiosis-specific protein ASY2-like n=1 Tax=Eutrema salsugineum TaxID=72664 RepID=UPI000CED60EA|nr:meiosis-specific protein ASY2-like [Eutrema salsugineum]